MKYIDAERLKAKLDEHYRKYQSKYMETRTPYTQGIIDALDLAEQVIDSLQQEQSSNDLEEAANNEYPRQAVYAPKSGTTIDLGYYLRKAFISGAEWQKKQSEVDLGADIEMEWNSFNKHLVEYGNESKEVVWLDWYSFNDVARYFYEQGKNNK
jgi:hypothetical protein